MTEYRHTVNTLYSFFVQSVSIGIGLTGMVGRFVTEFRIAAVSTNCYTNLQEADLGGGAVAIGSNIKQFMDSFGVSTQELARRSGVPRTTLAGILSGEIRNPRIDTLEKVSVSLSELAGRPVNVEDLSGGRPDPSDRIDWLWTARFNRLDLDDITEMRGWPTNKRIAWCVTQLIDAFGVSATAERLGYDPADVELMAAGHVPPQRAVQTSLERKANVPAQFLLYGDPPVPNESLRALLSSPDAGTWLAFIVEATRHGISPELMRRQLDLLLAARNVKTPAT